MIHPYVVDEWNISIFKMKGNYSIQRDYKGKISIFVFKWEASYYDIIGLMDRNVTFAEEHNGIFEGRNVHFGSCSTLCMTNDEVLRFKYLTKARMITGYTRDVSFTPSFIFETWLLNTICLKPGYAGKRIKNLAEKEMPYYSNLFGFEAF
ncbi:MAG: hypothetical protein K2F69_07545 [Bacteroidaceae bacterium]|nr:hypothetical protein [Bacteroidaceae bacterium]